MGNIEVASPTRVDLAGGTLDCWPLYSFVGDCHTVNLSINVMTGCRIEAQSGSSVEVNIEDLKYKKVFISEAEFFKVKDKEVQLLQGVLKYKPLNKGYKISTYSKSPVGGGLGGSSSLCISILKAIFQFHQLKLSNSEIITIASNIEAQLLNTPTGTQDYVGAIDPGLNIIHYSTNGMRIEKVAGDLQGLTKKIFLVNTGKSHHSGINNWQVIKACVEGDKNTFKALQDIAKVASNLANVCRQQKWEALPELFRAEFDARVRLSAGFSSPEIEAVEKIALGQGADAVKILGAGGGGCVLVWAEPDKHQGIKEKCQKNGYQPIDIQPVIKMNPS